MQGLAFWEVDFGFDVTSGSNKESLDMSCCKGFTGCQYFMSFSMAAAFNELTCPTLSHRVSWVGEQLKGNDTPPVFLNC